MAKFPRITTPTLYDLLERVPGWRAMPPAEAITAIGKAEANDVFHQYFTAIAEEPNLHS